MAFGTATAGDPKFWPAWIRYTILANLCFFVFMGNAYAAGITTGFALMAQEFRVGFAPLTDLVSWAVFSLGVSNLWWMPLALCVGKRPVIIISMMIFLAGNIWSIFAPTLGSLQGSRVVACFGAGSIESLGPAIIADLFFERYFATAIGLFSACLSGGSQLGPVFAGYLIEDRGWRWFFKLCAILNGINILFVLFFLPETTYRRPYVYQGETAAEIDKEATQMIEEKEKTGDVELVATGGAPGRPYAGTYIKDLWSFGDRAQEETGLRAFPKQFSLPFRFVLVPGALFAAVSYGVVLSGIILISAQTPQLFSPPPYLFSSNAIGLFTLASFLGVVIAYPMAGPLTDLLSRFMTRKHNGVHQPEDRVPALILPFLLCPWGLILFAWTVSEGRSPYVAAVGYAAQAAALCFVPSVVLSYVVDAYPLQSGEALVLINAGKNLVGFGLVLGNANWLASQGLKKMYAEVAALQWGVLLLGLPLYFAGPWMRRKTQWLV